MMAGEEKLGGSVGLDTTNFKKGVAELKNQIKNMETGFRASAVVMGDWAKTSDGLKSRVSSLKDEIGKQKQIMQGYREELKKVSSGSEADQKAADSLADKMYSLQKQIGYNTRDFAKFSTELSKVAKNEKDAANPISGLKNAFIKLAKESKDSTSSIKNQFKGLKSAILGAGIGAGIAGIAKGLYSIAESASDLVEAQNVVQQTFKKSNASVLAWTDTMAASAGIGKTAATQMVGTMGAMLKSSGLTEQAAGKTGKGLVQLTGDLSSFFNVSTSDMWEKVRSGISGQTKPLKELGINMDVANLSAYALKEGITKSWKSMSQAEQTTLRYNYLLSVTKDAQGDFARTSSTSMANQARIFKMNIENMKETVGAAFLPMMNNMFKTLNPFIKSIIPKLSAEAKKLANDIKSHSSQISKSVKDVTDTAENVFKFVSSNGAAIKNTIIATAAAVGVWKTAMLVANTVTTIHNGLETLGIIKSGAKAAAIAAETIATGAQTAATVEATKAQTALDIAEDANPIVAATIAIGAAAAAITILSSRTYACTATSASLIKSLKAEDDSYASLKKTEAAQESSNLTEIDHVERLYGVLKKLTGANGKIIGDKEEAKIAIDEINKLFPGSIRLVDGERVAYEKDDKAIKKLIETKKAQIILDAKEPAYKKAVTDVQSTAIKQSQLYTDMIKNQTALRELQTKAEKAGSNAGAVLGTDWQQRANALGQTVAAEKAEYNKSGKTIKGYYSDISNYESLSAAITNGDQKKMQAAISNTNLTYTKATGASKLQLKQQYDDANTYLALTQQRFKKHWAGVTSDTVSEAKQLRDKAYAQYKLVGDSSGSGVSDGFKSKKAAIKKSGTDAGNSAVAGVKSTIPALKSAGANAAQSLADGMKQFNKIKSAGSTAGQSYVTGLKSQLPSLSSWRAGLQSEIAPTTGIFSTAGANAGKSYLKGLKSQLPTLNSLKSILQAKTMPTTGIFSNNPSAGANNTAGKAKASSKTPVTAAKTTTNAAKAAATATKSAASTATTAIKTVSSATTNYTAKIAALRAEIAHLNTLSTKTTNKATKAAYKTQIAVIREEIAKYQELKTVQSAHAKEVKAAAEKAVKALEKEKTALSSLETKGTSLLSKLDKAGDTYENKVKTRVAKLKTDIKAVVDDYNKQVSDLKSSIYSSTGLFDAVSNSNGGVSADTLTSNLQGQVSQLKNWQTQIASLKSKGVPPALLSELEALGPSATSDLQALNSMTSDQLKQYQTLWSQKNSISKSAALSELESAKTESLKKIKELQTGAAKDLATYAKTWKTSTSSISKQLKTLAASTSTYGKDMMKGLAAGIKSEIGSVNKAVDAVTKAISAKLHFSRPDTGPLANYESWMPDMMTGLAKGITANKYKVAAAVQSLTSDMSIGVKAAAANTASTKSATTTTNSQLVFPQLNIMVYANNKLTQTKTIMSEELRSAALNRAAALGVKITV